ncbi:DNA-binding transcriptional response regulator, NtrC family, contains REC, AAA-type ATPase, and a Fis-type DNA-binding domains [Desulfuromusa kysingii]|uniref:DNA-binding transcriptional response regulator, NtrC family, contains REC, AAA-type ATPase, and a Fis-type DNA-binding domains n=1 Tax=Desulfuromusa kysingii TaxID=37625 RepID=A0A1H4AGL0_9BACT|nr:sigma-54 dependent transcriptional regulator [Desulfuromusa kysingii]SEA35060.1 DNA-binding transcriptional response regulator, NtrC family, contains REC, AAA-type ATPase, and a Fis-type DNA-binding domains [Desulfuromusa kysingii]
MQNSTHILVVDDTQSFRFLLKNCLDDAGYHVTCVASAAEALTELAQNHYDMVLSDMVMPKMDGLELLRQINALYPQLLFVLITAHGSVDSAVAAMKEGASEYLLKPLNWDELLFKVARLVESAQQQRSYARMLASDQKKFSFQNIVSTSPTMGQVLASAQQVATSPQTTVSIFGESGVGKEVLARAIHIATKKDMTSFVAINCAAIPETLLESELFGHVRGAFTGADRDRQGKCSRAEGGTLFLDEIGDMPLSLQPKLLRLLEERVYEKVGSDQPVSANFRIIVATHCHLDECCHQGRFRRDLYHRLNIFPLTIPPLRERLEDIPQLTEHFLTSFRQHQGKTLPGISKAALNLMLTHDWPGNIRELRNLLEYAAIVTNGELIQPEHLRLQSSPLSLDDNGTDRVIFNFNFSAEEFSLAAIHRQVIEWALEKCNNNKSSAARLLKASRKIFY